MCASVLPGSREESSAAIVRAEVYTGEAEEPAITFVCEAAGLAVFQAPGIPHEAELLQLGHGGKGGHAGVSYVVAACQI